MLTIYSLIQNKVKEYINFEINSNQSAIANIIKYIEKQNRLREPQKEAIKTYLWLKFIGQNKKLSEIVKEGILYDEKKVKEFDYYQNFQNNYTTLFLSQFAQENNLNNLLNELLRDPRGENHNWDTILSELLHNFDYPNYLFSLPMGAGKTYLMACFIYLDLFFANSNKKDKRFAHNFIIFAPTASKTAILPSLQTIKNFYPEWILPEEDAKRLRQLIHIEILDSLSSKRKDKLQGNNPNLEKVNRISQTKDFGMVFITNAEKVILEKYEDKDKIYVDSSGIFYDEKKISEIKKINELREKLSQISNLTVILDEVHHTYGKNENGEKKLRQAVNVLNQHNNLLCVLGFSGTPYIKNSIQIGDSQIKLNQIQDIVYNYSLSDGIGNFLKIPDIKSINVQEKEFIKKALDEFFSDFNITYSNETKSKIAFYCPSIKKLNDDILPVIQEWYSKNRQGKEKEIFRYYSNVDKKNRQYALPKENLAIFNNLDKPYSDKRVVLLVATGTEGWDCKSLTSVVLPRQKTTKNFVLQTTCRCLREIDNAKNEKALIFLDKENYETLDQELKENYNLTIGDLKISNVTDIPVKVRKPKLGKLKYEQIYKKFEIISKEEVIDYRKNLNDFDFNNIKLKFPYDEQEIQAKIGRAGLVRETRACYNIDSEIVYSFEDFVYDIARYSYGKFNENELMTFEKELKKVFSQITEEFRWISSHPFLDIEKIIKIIISTLMNEILYKTDIVKEDVEIELLEWEINGQNYIPFAGGKFLPNIEYYEAHRINKRPNRVEEDFEDADMDPNDISFNYIPYRMDSDYERNALNYIIQLSELKGYEIYYNGYKNEKLKYFWIKTDYGDYTPDFLIIKRKDNKKYKNQSDKGDIEKVLIIETKGKTYYNDEFKRKEKFVKEIFLKHNPKFKYFCFIDEEGRNDFSKNLNQIRDLIQNF